MKRLFGLMAAGALTVAASHAPAVTVITDFEAITVGEVALFRAPSFSGSTATNFTASTSAVIDTDSFGGSQSLELTATWAAASPADAKGRVTTFNSPNVPNPIINFSQYLIMDVKVVSGDLAIVGILVRDNNAVGDIGTDGGAAGSIEWVQQRIDLDDVNNADWTTIAIDIANPEGIAPFASAADPAPPANGELDQGPQGTLDALYIEKLAAESFVLLVDNVRQAEDTAVSEWTLY